MELVDEVLEDFDHTTSQTERQYALRSHVDLIAHRNSAPSAPPQVSFGSHISAASASANPLADTPIVADDAPLFSPPSSEALLRPAFDDPMPTSAVESDSLPLPPSAFGNDGQGRSGKILEWERCDSATSPGDTEGVGEASAEMVSELGAPRGRRGEGMEGEETTEEGGASGATRREGNRAEGKGKREDESVSMAWRGCETAEAGSGGAGTGAGAKETERASGTTDELGRRAAAGDATTTEGAGVIRADGVTAPDDVVGNGGHSEQGDAGQAGAYEECGVEEEEGGKGGGIGAWQWTEGSHQGDGEESPSPCEESRGDEGAVAQVSDEKQCSDTAVESSGAVHLLSRAAEGSSGAAEESTGAVERCSALETSDGSDRPRFGEGHIRRAASMPVHKTAREGARDGDGEDAATVQSTAPTVARTRSGILGSAVSLAAGAVRGAAGMALGPVKSLR